MHRQDGVLSKPRKPRDRRAVSRMQAKNLHRNLLNVEYEILCYIGSHWDSSNCNWRTKTIEAVPGKHSVDVIRKVLQSTRFKWTSVMKTRSFTEGEEKGYYDDGDNVTGKW
jgi:hypothetical protein